jgi:L-aminopeptidase/D-esterase-like protein
VPSFAIEGVRVGNVTRDGAGVTGVVFPPGSIGSCEVRGGAVVEVAAAEAIRKSVSGR